MFSLCIFLVFWPLCFVSVERVSAGPNGGLVMYMAVVAMTTCISNKVLLGHHVLCLGLFLP